MAETVDLSYRDRHSRAILTKYYDDVPAQELLEKVAPHLIDPDILKGAGITPARPKPAPQEGDRNKVIGIIGAGVAGLYAAMILEDLDVNYEILEATEDVGGRLLTHHFNGGANDYYDIGAMRFPENKIMERTFELFERLEFIGFYARRHPFIKPIPPPVHPDVIPYILSTPKDIQYFNRIRRDQAAIKSNDELPEDERQDLFNVSLSKGGTVPDEFVRIGINRLIKGKLQIFKDAVKRDFATGWKKLMAYDMYSMRQFLQVPHPELQAEYPPEQWFPFPYPVEVVNWLETWASGTGNFDKALPEAVIDSLEFEYEDNVKWWCISGGVNRIAQAMREKLRKGPIRFKFCVSKVAPVRDSRGVTTSLKVTVHNQGTTDYGHVISSIPLGAVRMVDLDECNLSYALSEALRALGYGPSTKVGMRFKTRWWEKLGHVGGVSKTDRMSRMIVYPSYGIHDPSSASMLVSYSWGQDALRLGSLINNSNIIAHPKLRELVLQDLAQVHQIPYKSLDEECLECHAWNWYGDEYSVGAFAFFAPGNFSTMYQEVTQPAADHLLHFAGEATSTNHAWVVGALNSAFRSVYQVLCKEGWSDKVKLLKERWGPMPPEMTERQYLEQLLLGQDAGEFANKMYKIYHPNHGKE